MRPARIRDKKMKKGFEILVAAITVILVMTVGCEKKESKEKIGIKGLSLYWYHNMFNEQGRGYGFSFNGVERFENLYELKFEYQIDNHQKRIEVSLVDIVDKGKNIGYPDVGFGTHDGLYSPWGNIHIPENMVNEGKYIFTVKTPNFTVKSEIIFTKEKATMNVPENNYFSSRVTDIFIAPKNLLFGRINFSEEQNKEFALDFLNDIRDLGLQDTIWTNPNIFLTNVDESGIPVITSYWVSFLFTMNTDFVAIFELSKTYFSKGIFSSMDVYSTNGDEARLNSGGVRVWFAK